MAIGYGLCVHIVYGHHVISCMGTWHQAKQSHTEVVCRSYGIVQLPCRLYRFYRKLYGACVGSAQRPSRDGVVTV